MRGGGVAISVTSRLRNTPGSCSAKLTEAARAALTAEGFGSGELSIALVGERAMRRLHHEYMNLDTPTDVLTFDLGTDRRRRRIEGEIILCAAVARRAAGGTKATPRRVLAELALYVVHGVLHLAGYDDHSPREYERMHAREDEILCATGFGGVFARGERSSS